MKYSKKVLAFVLCLAIATALCPMVCADETGAFSVVDNFDSLDITDTAFAKYPNGSLGQTSDVFIQDSKNQKGFKIVETEGVDGNTTKALEIANTNGDWVYLPFSDSFIHRDGLVTQFSYDVKFTKIPGDNPTPDARSATFFLYGGSNGFKNNGQTNVLTAPDNNSSITLEKNLWYTLVCKIGADGKLSTYLLNTQTGDAMLETATNKKFADGSAFGLNAIQFRANGATVADGTKVYITCQIDNAKVVQYDPAMPPEISSASIENGETEVIRNEKLTFNFNQGLAPDSYVTLTSENEDVIGCSVSASAFGKLTVSFDELLERNTTYTLSLSGVKNESNVACEAESIVFKTEDLHIWNDVEILSVSSGDTTQISFILSDIYSYPTFSGMVMAAAYEGGKMTGIDIVELANVLTESELTKSFDIGTVSSQTEIQLMLLDKEYGPLPLASGKTAAR
ncbi:MAG: Ig-like domain-containing protein [Clostridia bacterium]|nr:Ig-like domain-containing protein [Clostridia bacterium]